MTRYTRLVTINTNYETMLDLLNSLVSAAVLCKEVGLYSDDYKNAKIRKLGALYEIFSRAANISVAYYCPPVFSFLVTEMWRR
jgi:hypothetical protein